jgi:GH24 family phage-related lysozyme (muramidase)
VPWEAAYDVFEKHTLPNWYLKTLRIYPQMIDLHGDCAAALVSLVFNRGASLSGDRRKEMLEIQQLLRKGKLDEIPAQFRAMRRLWPETEGLKTRRSQEAELFAGGLALAGE